MILNLGFAKDNVRISQDHIFNYMYHPLKNVFLIYYIPDVYILILHVIVYLVEKVPYCSRVELLTCQKYKDVIFTLKRYA